MINDKMEKWYGTLHKKDFTKCELVKQVERVGVQDSTSDVQGRERGIIRE